MTQATLDISRRPTPSEPQPFPQTIHTTSKTGTFPDQFNSWEYLSTRDGWEVRYYDNDGIWAWMVKIFGKANGQAEAEVLNEYERLPSGVSRGKSGSYPLRL